MLDDLVLTAATLAIAASCHLLPAWKQWQGMADWVTLADTLSRALALTARVGLIFAVYAVLKFIYYTAFISHGGKTPGCRILGLRVVAADGNPAGLRQAALRALAGGIVSHTPVVGHLLRFIDYGVALFTARNQAARDLVADTLLVHDSAAPSRRGPPISIQEDIP